MKIFSHKTALPLAVLLLNACGGGGGDSAAPTPVSGAGVNGYKLHAYDDGTGNGTREISRGATSSSDFNVLRIDGQDYQLKVPGLQANAENLGLLNFDNDDRTAKTGVGWSLIPGLRYSNVGILTLSRDFDSRGDWLYVNGHFFHQGITPSAMPSGRARYEGTSYLFSYGPEDGDRSLYDTRGAAHFDVDFDAKTISGRLDNRIELDTNDIRNGFNFTGAIQGNQFSAHQDKIFYSGGFYGPNGEELGGLMRHDEDKVGGMFSANKQ